MGEKRVTILVPDDLNEWIAQHARANDRSISAQLRSMIREAKEREEAQGAEHEAA
jgi:predicted transcriptional regulator